MRKFTSILPALFFCLHAAAQQFPSTVDLSRQVSIIGAGMEIRAITVDSTGNVYLAGTSTQGFPEATQTIGPRGRTDLFVIKMNNTLDQVIYATAIGGSDDESVQAIKVDTEGNLYLLGGTNSMNFPSSTRFFEGFPIGSMALKLNPAGSQLVYATILGSRVTARAFDIDNSGAAYIGGLAHAQDLPSTPGVLNPPPPSGVDPDGYGGYIAKLAPNGTAWQLATYYGPANKSVEAVSVRPNGNVLILSNGNLVSLNAGLSQQASSVATSITPGSLAFDNAGNAYVSGTDTTTSAFAIKKYSPAGAPVALAQADLGLASGPSVPRIAVTGEGRIYVFGRPAATNFPTLNGDQACLANVAQPLGTAGLADPDTSGGLIGSPGGNVGDDQAMIVLDASGNKVHATYLAAFVSLPAIAPTNGRIYAAASQQLYTEPRTKWSGVIRINQELTPPATVAPACVVHSATFDIVPLNPGGILTIFGTGLGPQQGTVFSLTDGKMPPEVAGTTVTVNGVPAPIWYTSNTQINFIAPWSTPSDGRAVPVCVNYGGASKCVQVGTGQAVPGAYQFDAGTPAARSTALNGDYSVNGPSNPAARGSAVAIFMTGGGLIDGSMVDGGVAGAELQQLKAAVTAKYSGSVQGCTLFGCPDYPDSLNLPVLYAGAAPGLVLGAVQVNLLIPNDMPVGENQPIALSFLVPGETKPVTAVVKISIR